MRFVDTFKIRLVDDAEFESKHGRDKNGQFTSGGSVGSSSESQGKGEESSDFDPQKYREFIGPEFKGVRRQAAIRKLMEERCGHVKGAFHRKDIGDIDLMWGDEKSGLCHIIKQRERQKNVSVDDFLAGLSDVIQNGDLLESPDKYEIWYRKKMAIVTKTFHGAKGVSFVLTACPSRKKPARFFEQA